MDDEDFSEKDDFSTTGQIPLIHDLVYDDSLPLKPPTRKPRTKSKGGEYSPHSDPDTIDLFGDDPESEIEINEEVADELEYTASHLIDELVEEYTEELSNRLRSELTEQLNVILETLNHKDKSE